MGTTIGSIRGPTRSVDHSSAETRCSGRCPQEAPDVIYKRFINPMAPTREIQVYKSYLHWELKSADIAYMGYSGVSENWGYQLGVPLIRTIAFYGPQWVPFFAKRAFGSPGLSLWPGSGCDGPYGDAIAHIRSLRGSSRGPEISTRRIRGCSIYLGGI